MSDLHMRKNTGWAYETELRLAVVDRDLENHEFDTPIYLPLGNCIAAVIFGDAYTDPAGIATGIRTALSPDSPEFFQCRWSGGAPRLEQRRIDIFWRGLTGYRRAGPAKFVFAVDQVSPILEP
jgi:hypothetical protein